MKTVLWSDDFFLERRRVLQAEEARDNPVCVLGTGFENRAVYCRMSVLEGHIEVCMLF